MRTICEKLKRQIKDILIIFLVFIIFDFKLYCQLILNFMIYKSNKKIFNLIFFDSWYTTHNLKKFKYYT